MEKFGINMGRVMTKMGALLVAGMALAMSGCAIHSVDENGGDCVVGQTCPGMFVKPVVDETIEGMTVVGVNKPGSDIWNNSIKVSARKGKMSEDDLRAIVGDKDFVQLRKMGFMFAINTHSGLYANGLKVGDTVNLVARKNPLDDYVTVVKRAGE